MNLLCYNNARFGICTKNGKMYWMARNMKFDSKVALNKDPLILDLALMMTEFVSNIIELFAF